MFNDPSPMKLRIPPGSRGLAAGRRCSLRLGCHSPLRPAASPQDPEMQSYKQKTTVSSPLGKYRFFMMILCCVILFPVTSYAEIGGDTLLNEVVDKFEEASQQWQPKIESYALDLLWILAGIEFICAGIFLTLRGADFQEFVVELCRRILLIGFFMMVLENSSAWSRAITDSFLMVAQEANSDAQGQNGLSPGVIFNIGLSFADKITSDYSSWDPIDRLGIKLSSYIIVICFALIAAQVLITLVEMYLVTSAGIILLGFGGTNWTKDLAFSYFRYLLSIAMKLFIIQLLVGLCEGFVMEWLHDITNEDAQITILIGASCILLSLVKQIPALMTSLLQGVHFSFYQNESYYDQSGVHYSSNRSEKLSTQFMTQMSEKMSTSAKNAVQWVTDVKTTVAHQQASLSGRFSQYKNETKKACNKK